MKYIAIIPARAGSKRIKNKNIIKLNNKKLIDYTIYAATKCNAIRDFRNSKSQSAELYLNKNYIYQ